MYLTRFEAYCHEQNCNPLECSEQTLVDFLSMLYQCGLGYSAINTARAAVSTLNGLGSSHVISRFMRGVFNLRPSCPRYTCIWDVSTVLNFLRKCSPARDLSLQNLSAKLLTLCALVTGHRCQSFHAMDLEHMDISDNKANFYIAQLLKHNSPKKPMTVLTLHAFPEDKRICVLTYLKHYLKRTKELRASTKLFISTCAPHKGVSKETLSRWIKLILSKSGIDTKLFKPHSTLAASTSAAIRNVHVNDVLRTADWSSEATFAKFYNRPLTSGSEPSFANSVLCSKAD